MMYVLWLWFSMALGVDKPPVESVVLLQQGGTTCSGVLIDAKGLVATSYHCIARGGRPVVHTHEGSRARGRVVAMNVAWDLALISAPSLAGTPHVELELSEPELGAEVRVVGHPYGVSAPGGFLQGTLRWSVSSGIVSAIGPKSIQITAPVNPGNSGGPVFNEEGRVIGIVSRRLKGDGLGFATRVGKLAEMTERRNGFHFLGGVLSAEIFASDFGGTGGNWAVGARVDAVFRDRLVLGINGAYAPTSRFDAVSRGSTSWSVFEGRAGVRQRFFRGYWTGRIEAYGGFAVLQVLDGDRATLRTTGRNPWGPMVGGQIGIASFSLDGAAVYVEGTWSWRGMFILRIPGNFLVF